MAVWMVSGGSGFLGRHLLDLLSRSPSPGVEVVAIGRRRPDGWPSDAFVPADFEDEDGVREAVHALRPAVVFHLAGRTPPAESSAFFRSNVGGTAALLHALEAVGTPSRVVLAGSAAEYGPVPASLLPIGPMTPCRPEGSYGLSKWCATRLTVSRRGPVEGIAARIFNPIGPGMPSGQAFGRFAARLAAPGPDPMTLATGGLDARRDFIDARDVASSLVAMALRGRPGAIYPVGSGTSRSIAEGLDHLVALSGRRVDVRIEPSGHTGPSHSRADIAVTVRETGWSPRIPFEESLADLWASVSGTPTRGAFRLDANSPQPPRSARPPGVSAREWT